MTNKGQLGQGILVGAVNNVILNLFQDLKFTNGGCSQILKQVQDDW